MSALPSVLAEKEEDVINMNDFLGTLGEGDEEEKKKILEGMMKHEQEKFCGSNVLLDRLGDLWDELVDTETN